VPQTAAIAVVANVAAAALENSFDSPYCGAGRFQRIRDRGGASNGAPTLAFIGCLRLFLHSGKMRMCLMRKCLWFVQLLGRILNIRTDSSDE